MKPRTWLTTLGIAVCSGLMVLRRKAGEDELPTVWRETLRTPTPDPRMFGHGLPIEQAGNGREYVVVEGKPVVLMPAGEYGYEFSPDAEVVLTEDGLRLVDPAGDLTSKRGLMVQRWRDPTDGALKPLSALPKNAIMVGKYEVDLRQPGGRVRVPIIVRGWQEGDPD